MRRVSESVQRAFRSWVDICSLTQLRLPRPQTSERDLGHVVSARDGSGPLGCLDQGLRHHQVRAHPSGADDQMPPGALSGSLPWQSACNKCPENLGWRASDILMYYNQVLSMQYAPSALGSQFKGHALILV